MKKNLKQARVDAGITQAEIAKRTNVTYQMVYQWEKGTAPVARKHWKTLASLLHVTEEELEEIIVQTMLELCIAGEDARPLLNARISRLYRPELITDALAQFNGRPPRKMDELFDTAMLKSKLEILELQNRIFKLEAENAELRLELERRRPARPISSSSMIEVN